MIESVQIQNFRCLKSVEALLRPLTVLIGPNDSGKSTFLRALSVLVREQDLMEDDAWQRDPSMQVLIEATGQGWSASAHRQGNASSWSGNTHALPRGRKFTLPSSGIPAVCAGTPDNQRHAPELAQDGGNVPALLDFLLRRDREHFKDFVDAVKARIPGLMDVEIATPQADKRRLDLVIENGLVVPSDVASTGIQFLLFYLAIAFHPAPPGLIMIEEPEQGLHPKRLEDVVKLLRDITKGIKGAAQSQVVLTTHSPYLLDFIDPQSDQVLVFSRGADGSCMAQPVNRERLKHFTKEFLLGEIWYNESEEGLVKKSP